MPRPRPDPGAQVLFDVHDPLDGEIGARWTTPSELAEFVELLDDHGRPAPRME